MAMKSINDTFIYKHLNRENGLTTGIQQALQEGKVLNKNNVEEAMLIINKNFKYPLKFKVLEALDKGDIVLLYSPEKVRIPTCLPFFLTKGASGKVVAIVLVDMYGKMNPDTGVVTIDPKKLYCMMEGAYLGITYFYHANDISKRNIIITAGASIYSNMFTRVLNKRYALNVDKSKMQKVLFLATRFYTLNMLGMNDGEMAVNYAIKNIPNANPFSLRELDSLMQPEDYTDLSTFILALTRPELNLGFKDLTVRGYLESFITMYDGSALFALEYFPYFIYNIISVVNGAYINNQYIMEDIVDRYGAKIYTDLLSFER